MKNNTTNSNTTQKGLKTTMKFNKTITSLFAASALSAIALGAANADINPAQPGAPASITPVANGYAYTYTAVLNSTQTLVKGSYFTFFDVAGLVSDSETFGAADYTASEAFLGPIATGSFSTSPTTDNPTLKNVTFTYNGANTIVGQPTTLGLFGFTSIYGTASTVASFSAVAQKTGTNILNSNATTYDAPTATAVPEPATVVPFVLGGLGLLVLAARKTRRAGSATA